MDEQHGVSEMSEYQPYVEKRAADLVKYMEGQWMTTTMLIEAVAELCAQQGIDLEQRARLEKVYAEWRKEQA
jgi:hypothetical protein